MPKIYFYDKEPIDLTDQEYNTYQRNFVNQDMAKDPNQRPGAIPAYDRADDGSLTPVSQEPKANSLESYGNPGGDPTSGLWSRGGVGIAGGAAAWMGANPMLGAAGLYLTAAEAVRQAVHGDSFTPDKYKTLTEAGRSHYLDDKGEHRNPYNRASDMSSTYLQTDSPGTNEPPKGLVNYLDKVQPYEEMAYYNPKNDDIPGKIRAYGLSNWARQRMQDRWQGDMEGIESQELAKKYGLELPEHLKKKGPFKVDFSQGY